MAETDLFKRTIPTGDDGPPDINTALKNYSLTDHAPVKVANMTEANSLAAQAPATAFPLLVILEDLRRLVGKISKTSGWEILGGRLHGAHANCDRAADNDTVTELHVTSFSRQSVGFTRASNGGILIPETGLYRVRIGGSIDGINSVTPGRRFFGWRLNGTEMLHTDFTGDTVGALFDEWPMSKGDVVMPVGYQKSGSRRTFSATVGVYQSLNPSW